MLPSDHYIHANKESLNALVKQASELAGQEHLVTFGITPTHAETGYGYIKQGEVLGSGYKVASFTEKPDAATAKAYIKQGDYVWNSGMFLFPVLLLLQELQRFVPDVLEGCKAALKNGKHEDGIIQPDEKAYDTIPSISIDYAVMEKTDKAAMIPAAIAWSDMGSYHALWEHQKQDDNHNATMGDAYYKDASGNYIHTQTPAYVLGVDDLVVVQTEQALLVANKNRMGEVSEFANQAEPQASAKTHKPWGYYELVHVTPHTVVKQLYIKPGARLSLQKHEHRSEHWVVMSGLARVTKDDELLEIKAGESVFVPAGTTHRLENNGQDPLFIMEVQTGSYLGEDDIIRFEDDYGRVAS